MHKRILVTVFSLMLANALVLPAARAATDMAQIEKLGAVRTRVTARLIELQKLADAGCNGSYLAGSFVLEAYLRNSSSANKRLQQENVKPADSRDQAVVDAMTTKANLALTLWNSQASKDNSIFAQQLTEFQNTVNQLTLILNSLSQLDQAWVRAETDPGLLTADFLGLDKRIDSAIASFTPQLESYKKLCADRVHQMDQ